MGEDGFVVDGYVETADGGVEEVGPFDMEEDHLSIGDEVWLDDVIGLVKDRSVTRQQIAEVLMDKQPVEVRIYLKPADEDYRAGNAPYEEKQ